MKILIIIIFIIIILKYLSQLISPVNILLGLVSPVNVEEKCSSVVEGLVISSLPLLLQLQVVGRDGLPVQGGAPLVGPDEGQEGAELDLTVRLDQVKLSDSLLQLTLQHQSQTVEKLKCRVATEPLHPLHRGKLHGVVLLLPAVVVDLRLDESVGVRHAGVGICVMMTPSDSQSLHTATTARIQGLPGRGRGKSTPHSQHSRL